MSAEADRLRVDVWLWRARFAKTRAAATRMIVEGGVRMMRDGQTRRLEKASATVSPGDALVFSVADTLRTVEVLALGGRRGPATEAKTLYRDLGAHRAVGSDPLA